MLSEYRHKISQRQSYYVHMLQGKARNEISNEFLTHIWVNNSLIIFEQILYLLPKSKNKTATNAYK